MKTVIETLEIVNFERKHNSINGNPCYSITFKDIENGNIWTGKTKSDACFVYGLSLRIGQKYEVKNHETKKSVIIDGMKLIK